MRDRPRSREELTAIVAGLADRLSGRMRAAGQSGRTVTLRLRFRDFSRATRSHTFARASADADELAGAADALLEATLPELERRGLTCLGLSVSNLEDSEQLALDV